LIERYKRLVQQKTRKNFKKVFVLTINTTVKKSF